jgi:hypothetical protein
MIARADADTVSNCPAAGIELFDVGDAVGDRPGGESQDGRPSAEAHSRP